MRRELVMSFWLLRDRLLENMLGWLTIAVSLEFWLGCYWCQLSVLWDIFNFVFLNRFLKFYFQYWGVVFGFWYCLWHLHCSCFFFLFFAECKFYFFLILFGLNSEE